MSIPYKVNKGIRDNAEKLSEHLSAITSLVGIASPATLEADFNNIKVGMEASGYEGERFGEIVHDSYMQNLKDRLESLLQDDAEIAGALRSAWTTGKIVVRYSEAAVEWSYHRVSFEAGSLVITIAPGSFWTNVGDIGREIPDLLTVSDVPYAADKNIRACAADLADKLAAITATVGLSGPCSLEADYASLAARMEESSYTVDRFGDIYHSAYVGQIADKLKELVDGDAAIAEPIRENMGANKIVIRAVDDSGDWSYHRVLFENGSLVVEIKPGCTWTNLGDIGREIPDLL
jgi:hypothetical protein